MQGVRWKTPQWKRGCLISRTLFGLKVFFFLILIIIDFCFRFRILKVPRLSPRMRRVGYFPTRTRNFFSQSDPDPKVDTHHIIPCRSAVRARPLSSPVVSPALRAARFFQNSAARSVRVWRGRGRVSAFAPARIGPNIENEENFLFYLEMKDFYWEKRSQDFPPAIKTQTGILG